MHLNFNKSVFISFYFFVCFECDLSVVIRLSPKKNIIQSCMCYCYYYLILSHVL